MEVAQLYASLNLDDAQFQRQLNNTKSGLLSVSGIMGGISRMAPALISVEAFRRAAGALIKTGAEMESYRQRLRAVIKDQAEADRTFARVEKWAAVNPVDTDEAIASFVQLKAAAVENSEEAIKSVANLSAVMGRDMREVAAAVISGETESLRRLGIMIDRSGKQATVQSGRFRLAVENDITAVRKAILEIIGLNFAGAMEKAKDSFGGVTKTISGQLQMVRKDLAGLSEGAPFRNIVSGLREASASMELWTDSRSYKEFIRTFHSGANFAIDATKGLARGAVGVFGSDVTQELLKWGIGLKAAELAGRGVFSTLKGGKALLLGGLGVINSTAARAGSAITSVGKAMDTAATATFSWKGALGSAAGLLTPGGAMLAGMGALALYAEMSAKNFKALPAELMKTQETLSKMTVFSGNGILGSGMEMSEQVRQWTKSRADETRRALADAMSKAHEDEAIQLREAMTADSRFNWPDELGGGIAKLPSFGQPLKDAVKDITETMKAELAKADRSIREFGLSSGEVYSEIAERVKAESADVLKGLRTTYGPAGVPALVKSLEQLVGKVPGMDILVRSFREFNTEAQLSTKRVSELNGEIGGLSKPMEMAIRAYKGGFLPKGAFSELQAFLQKGTAEISRRVSAVTDETFGGMSPAFRNAISSAEQSDLMKSLGMQRQRVMSDLRPTGGHQSQPGTIGHISTRYEVRPTPQVRGERAWLDDQVQATHRAQGATKEGPKVTVNVGTVTATGADGRKLGELVFDILSKKSVVPSLSVSGAAQ